MKTKKWIASLLFLSFLAFAAVLGAIADDGQHTPPPPPMGGACRADVQKFCGEMKPGDGQFGKCVMDNHDKFSDACKVQGEKMKERMHALMDACKDDIQSKCGGEKGGHAQTFHCLRDHQGSLKKECADYFRNALPGAQR